MRQHNYVGKLMLKIHLESLEFGILFVNVFCVGSNRVVITECHRTELLLFNCTDVHESIKVSSYDKCRKTIFYLKIGIHS